MYTVYVLFSKKYNKIYIGYTSDLKSRLISHNEMSKKGWTLKFRPWILVYSETFEKKVEALSREKQLKFGKGREWIWSEIIAKL
jgi:putative endonuclease